MLSRMLLHSLIGVILIGGLAFLWQAYGQGGGVNGTASLLSGVMGTDHGGEREGHEHDD